jgi:hypothetical protein
VVRPLTTRCERAGNIPDAGASDVTAGGKFVTVGAREGAIWFRINGGHGAVPKYLLQTMGDASLTLQVDEYKAGGALFMTSKPSLGNTSYFRFNTASGDGTLSPDGHPHLAIGVATMGQGSGHASESGAASVPGPGTNFETMLREQAPEEYAERQEKIKRQKTPRTALRRVESVREVLESKRAGAVTLCLVPKDDPNKLQFLLCAGKCPLETDDLKAVLKSMCHKTQRHYEEMEARHIADLEMNELARFRQEKEQFGPDYLEGSKNKERLARMQQLEAKYPDSHSLRQERDARLNASLTRSSSLKRSKSVKAGSSSRPLAPEAPSHAAASPLGRSHSLMPSKEELAGGARASQASTSPQTAAFRHVVLDQGARISPATGTV